MNNIFLFFLLFSFVLSLIIRIFAEVKTKCKTMTREASHKNIHPEFDDVRQTPIAGLPQTLEQAVRELEEGEQELARGESISWSAFKSGMRQYIKDYAARN